MSLEARLIAAALVLFACGSKSRTAGPLVLEAYGGPAGKVATEALTPEPGAGTEKTCDPPIDAGSCQLTSCKLGGIGSPAFGFGDDGPISVTAGKETVSLTYSGKGYPTVYFPSSVTLGTGGTMRFRGGGSGGIPSFDVTATIPGVGALSAPVAAADGGVTSIDTTQDLVLNWASIPAGQMHLYWSGDYGGPGSTLVSLTCTFDGSTGSGVVPQALLSSMAQMTDGGTQYLSLGSELDVTTVVDGLTITTQSYQATDPPQRDLSVVLR
ncbi:MAG: hypothetical protein QM723_39080 [Myxococcaceae bacterium]